MRPDTPEDLTAENGLLYYEGSKLYVPNSQTLRLRILRNFHNSPTAGHYSQERTLYQLEQHFYWPEMRHDVKEYVKTCETCQRIKTPHHAQHGELAPLPAPCAPWQGITLDFLTDLLWSTSALETQPCDCVLVIMCRFSKMCRYIPCRNDLTAKDFAILFIKEIIRDNGVPDTICSDRGSLFTSYFWTTLARQLGADHTLTTAFHQQADGQSERQMQIVAQYLHGYVNYQQDNWVDLLPLAEYCHNSTYQASIKCTPFYASRGRQPRPFQIQEAVKEDSVTASEFTEAIKALHKTLEEEIAYAQNTQAKYYDRRSRPIQFNKGDKVWLKSTNL